MANNPLIWAGTAAAPLSKIYSALTSNKVTIPLMAGAVLSPVVGSALSRGKPSRKQRLGEFVPDQGELAEAFNNKQAALQSGLDNMKQIMEQAKQRSQIKRRGVTSMAELV